MPNLRNAKKALRRAEDNAVANSPVRSRVKSARRKFMELVAAGNKEQSPEAYRDYCSALDRAAKTGVIKKNTASRRKGRAADRLRLLGV